MVNLGNDMRELARVCIMRTQILAESVFELSTANKALMEMLTQQSSALNETVRQVQYVTSSERQTKASMDQDGWIDRHLTELGQRAATQSQKLLSIEKAYERLNDTVRDIAVESQPSHVDQKNHKSSRTATTENRAMGSRGY